MKNILEVKNISYSVGENKILKDISFKCQSEEIIGIIGPNGSGKTTLLKTINGINPISSGDILLNGKSIKEYDEKELKKLEKKMLLHPERITEISKHILEVFDTKTHRNVVYNLKDRRLSGFNAMLAVQSVDAAKLYYEEFKKKGYFILNENFMPVGEEGMSIETLKSYKYILKSGQLTKQDFQMSKMVWLNTEFSIWNPNEGIDIFGFKLRYYGLMYVFAFGFGILIMRQIFKIDKVDEKFIDPLFTWTLLGTIFGARIGHVVFYEPSLFVTDFWSVFLPIRTKPTLEFTGFSGLASHGATIALILTTLYYSYRIIKKNPFWVYDRLGIVIALGGAFVRVGNFFNSEIIGKPASETSPFAILFPQQSMEYGAIVPRYPTQLFEAFGYVCLFILLAVLYKFTRKKYQQGWLFGLFFVILWSIRFFVEFLKEPQGNEVITFAGLNTGQVLSIPFMLAGVAIMIYSKKNKIEPAE